MAEHPSPEYIRKLRNDLANYRSLVQGLQQELKRYEAADDKTSVRSMREEIRRTEQYIESIKGQLP